MVRLFDPKLVSIIVGTLVTIVEKLDRINTLVRASIGMT